MSVKHCTSLFSTEITNLCEIRQTIPVQQLSPKNGNTKSWNEEFNSAGTMRLGAKF